MESKNQIKEKTLEKILDEKFDKFRECYFGVCKKRILFYNEIGNGSEKDIASCAYAFLCSLTNFEYKVPRKIIKEKFEDFRQAKSLAEEVMKKYL